MPWAGARDERKPTTRSAACHTQAHKRRTIVPAGRPKPWVRQPELSDLRIPFYSALRRPLAPPALLARRCAAHRKPRQIERAGHETRLHISSSVAVGSCTQQRPPRAVDSHTVAAQAPC